MATGPRAAALSDVAGEQMALLPSGTSASSVFSEEDEDVKVSTHDDDKAACKCSWACVALYVVFAVSSAAVASHATYLWLDGTLFSTYPALLVFVEAPPPAPPPAPTAPLIETPSGYADHTRVARGHAAKRAAASEEAARERAEVMTPPPPPRLPPPPPPPSPPPPPKVDCEASVGDRNVGRYQQYNEECTRTEGLPGGCYRRDGCQFCYIAGSKSEDDGIPKCEKWVCHKYDVTGCKGMKRDEKAERRKAAGVGKCKTNFGNRAAGRYTFADPACKEKEGIPSGCLDAGRSPCRFCVLTDGEKMEGWALCPTSVCKKWKLRTKQCVEV